MTNLNKAVCFMLAIAVIGTTLSQVLKPVTIEASSLYKVYIIKDQVLQFTPFFWTIAVIGGCIVITLAYVSYKKYQAEKKSREKDKTFD
jgi:hypothetical protein